MEDQHFKSVLYFCYALLASALAMSIYMLCKFGDKYAEQVLSFWLLTGGAAGIQAVTGVSIASPKKMAPPSTSTNESKEV